MEQNNLDKKNSSALENRTIIPSADSWETLSKRLDQNAKVSLKKLYYFIAFAASFIGVLLCVTLLFKTEEPAIIVDVNDDLIETKIIESNTVDNKVGNKKGEQNDVEKAVEEVIQNIPSNTRVAEHSAKQGSEIKTNQSKLSKVQNKQRETVHNTALDNSVAVNETSNLSKENSVTTRIENSNYSTQETENLLAAAQQKIALQKRSYAPRILDYNGLLNEVEDDQEETLRDKMLKTIKSSYYTVRAAVAERNE